MQWPHAAPPELRMEVRIQAWNLLPSSSWLHQRLLSSASLSLISIYFYGLSDPLWLCYAGGGGHTNHLSVWVNIQFSVRAFIDSP